MAQWRIRVTVNVTVVGSLPLGGMNYYLLTLSFLRSGNKALSSAT